MFLPDPTSSWFFKPINSRILSKDAMFDEHPSLCKLWPKLFFFLTEELSPKGCQSHNHANRSTIHIDCHRVTYRYLYILERMISTHSTPRGHRLDMTGDLTLSELLRR